MLLHALASKWLETKRNMLSESMRHLVSTECSVVLGVRDFTHLLQASVRMAHRQKQTAQLKTPVILDSTPY